MTAGGTGGRPNQPVKGGPPDPSTTRRQRKAQRDSRRALAQAGSGRASGSGPGGLLMLTGAVVLAGLIVLGLAILLSQQKANTGAPVAGSVVAPRVVTPGSIPAARQTLGRATAPVTIDIYGDFRCSACFGFTVTSGTEAQIVANYVTLGRAKIVWHDFLVIDRIDRTSESRDAANAAMCAADQGKFWPMHDWLYANQSPSESSGWFTQDRLIAIGRAAGLDMTAYQPCVQSGAHLADVAAEQQNAPSAVSGTPSIFVNGQIVDPGNVPNYATIATAIDAAGK
jgi:protein-disulfide isomerase